MINVIGSDHIRIEFREASKTVEIKDSNGLGMILDVDSFRELKEMIDFIYGANNLWRFTKDNEPPTLR